MVGGKWGFINRRGELVIPLTFEEARGFENGRASVKVKGEWKTIDAKGNFVKDSSDRSGKRAGKAQSPSSQQLFKLVEDLIQQRPFTPEGVARRIGCRLQPDLSASNQYFTMFLLEDYSKLKSLCATSRSG